MKDFRAIRSWLFVPGDSARKLEKCWSAGADAVIVDLEDSVAAENKVAARATAAEAIRRARSDGFGSVVVVRTNALETGLAEGDVSALVGAGADGFVVPKVAGSADVVGFAHLLDEAERSSGARPAALIPIATELPAAIFSLREIAAAHPRVRAIFWGMEDLGAEVGARRTRAPNGDILEAFRMVRSLVLFAASAAGIACVDTPFVDIANAAGLEKEATEASWMGFSGKLAIHPSQVGPINAAFSPSAEEVDEARTILRMSADGGGAAFRYKGRMIDTPHLLAARRLLARLGS